MKRINLYISDELYQAIHEKAKSNFLTTATYVKQTLHRIINNEKLEK